MLAQLRKDLPRTQFGHQPEPEPMFTGPRIRSILRAGRPRHPPSTMDNEMFLLCSPPLDSITTPLPSPATDGAVGSSGGDARTREEHIGMAHEGSNRELGRSTTTGVESPALDSLCHSFVHHPRVQATMERVLFCWSLRHPASGYVQGMSDLLAPFLSVVLAEYACPESHSVMELLQMDPIALSHALSEEAIPESTWRGALEPDVYALSGFLLDMAQGHYTQQQAGFLAMVERMDGILKQADPTLHQHLTDIGIETVQYAFRWMTCLLMRELQPWQVLRLLDAYLSVANEEEEVAGEIGRAAVPLDLRHHTLSTTTHHHHHHHGRENSGGSQSSVGDCLQLHVFTCVALVLHFAPALMSTTEFAEALTFLQQLPTETLSSRDIDELLAETFLLKSVFDK